MTMANVFVERDAVHVATDTAGLSAWSGKVAKFLPKMDQISGLPAVALVRGIEGQLPILVDALGAIEATDLDDLAVDLGDRLRRQFPRRRLFLGTEPRDIMFRLPWDLFVAGWSPTRGPLAFYLVNHRRHPGIAPWTIVPIPDLILGPVPDERTCRIATQAKRPSRLILQIAEAQRKVEQRVFGRTGPQIGGSVEMASITGKGIERRTVGAWPDVVGEGLAAAARLALR